MKSIEELYNRLKKHDSDNQLSISNDNNRLELKVNIHDKVIAFDDYVSIESKGEPTTHFHPDYNEMYCYFYNIMKGKDEIPTKKEVKRTQIQHTLIAITSAMMSIVFWGSVGGFLGGFFIIPMIVVSVIICILLISLPKKLVTFIRLTQVEKKDVQLMEKYISFQYPHSICASDFYLTFDYLRMISIKFLKQPNKIHLPELLQFSEQEDSEIKEITKNRKKDKDAEKLYEYYYISLDAIKIIYKYYNENGIRKK
jgi:hypothetical protein